MTLPHWHPQMSGVQILAHPPPSSQALQSPAVRLGCCCWSLCFQLVQVLNPEAGSIRDEAVLG